MCYAMFNFNVQNSHSNIRGHIIIYYKTILHTLYIVVFLFLFYKTALPIIVWRNVFNAYNVTHLLVKLIKNSLLPYTSCTGNGFRALYATSNVIFVPFMSINDGN